MRKRLGILAMAVILVVPGLVQASEDDVKGPVFVGDPDEVIERGDPEPG